MKIKVSAIAVVLYLCISQTLASPSPMDTVYIHADSLKSSIKRIGGAWRFHPGDNSAWAQPGFDVSQWDTIRTTLKIKETPWEKWKGMAWFRKTIVFDSTFLNKIILLRINHVGASEIYWNGEMVHRFGNVDSSAEREKIYQPNFIPVVISVGNRLTNTLAVRYSAVSLMKKKYWFAKWIEQAGFRIYVANANRYLQRFVDSIGFSYSINVGISGIFLALALLYSMLFLFYSHNKENLYYSLFTLSISVVFLNSQVSNLIHTHLEYLSVSVFIGLMTLPVIFISYLGFLYSIFYQKMPKLFWLFCSAAVLLAASFITNLDINIVNTFTQGFIFLATIEGLRVIIVALKQKKENAWVIGAGVIVFVILVMTIFVLANGSLRINSTVMLIFFLIGLLSLPLSMSVYLARDIAITNRNLELQLQTVRELSEKELEHQKKATELQLQAERERAAKNEAELRAKAAELQAQAAEAQSRAIQAESERKTRELEEARQLQLSMLPKKLPRLPNLDIAVYMQTATEVGGDYYDFHVGKDNVFTVVIGDATGHGMKAGTMVTIAKSLFSAYADNPDILAAFAEMSRHMKEMNFKFLSMCLLMLKLNGNRLRISSAGMPPALVYRKKEKTLEEILIKGMPLGATKIFPYVLKETTLAPGDTILLYSDGFPELFNEAKEMYGYERVHQTFEQIAALKPQAVIEHLKKAVTKWTGGKAPNDDVTFIVLKMK